MSPTVFREGPFRFHFFSLEEPRMHVHVTSAGGEAKIWMEPNIELARAHGLRPPDVTRVLRIARKRQQEIRDAWTEHFPS